MKHIKSKPVIAFLAITSVICFAIFIFSTDSSSEPKIENGTYYSVDPTHKGLGNIINLDCNNDSNVHVWGYE